MSVEQFITLVSALSLAILTPGPSIIAAVQTAFRHGRQRALPFALGLATGASLWCLLALAGLAVIFRLHPTLFSVLKIFGGFYLLWFAAALWRAARKPLPEASSAKSRGFMGGIALNLSNPKPAMFYATLILSIFPDKTTLSQQALIYLVCLATEAFWYSAVAIGMSTAPMRARYFSAKFWIDCGAATVMALLGLILIFKH